MTSVLMAKLVAALVLSQSVSVSGGNASILAFNCMYPCSFVPRWSMRQGILLGPPSCTSSSCRRNLSAMAMQSTSFDAAPIEYSHYVKEAENSNDACRIAYRYFAPKANKNSVTGTEDMSTESIISNDKIVIFLNGLLSNMSGTKSRSLQQYANEKGAGFLCFDYRGHGSSFGKFADCTMHDWMEDARHMMDHAHSLQCKEHGPLHSHGSIQPKVILVGSSMGAWIALNLAMEQEHPISGVLGIGSAIDFTHDAFQKLSEEQQSILLSQDKEDGCATPAENHSVQISSPYLDEPYPFSQALYESGNEYLLCHAPSDRDTKVNTRHSLNLSSSVRLLHGVEDDVVNSSTIKNSVETLRSKYHGKDVTVKLVQGGDHRLSRPEDISVLLDTLGELL